MKISHFLITAVAALSVPDGASAQTDFCGTLKQLTDASEADFSTIRGDSDGDGAYNITVALPFADSCKLDRELEKEFGELRYQCDYKALNFAQAGASTLAENVNIVGTKYADFVAGCRPDLQRKESESQWAKNTSFVDAKGQKWIDVTRLDRFFYVELFNGKRNPNY